MDLAGLADKRAYVQVLGGLLLNPAFLDNAEYQLDKTDFDTESFYKYIFVSIYNLYQQGIEKIDEYAIDSYLSNYAEQYKVFRDNNGVNWISDVMGIAQLENFDYYYHRVKKFALLRYYERSGLDTRCLYDGNKVDSSDEQKKFDDMTEQEMIDFVSSMLVGEAEQHYCSNQVILSCSAGEGMEDLIDSFLTEPDYGYPMTSLAANTLCRGYRKGTLTLRGACSGCGKTRSFLMDACNLAIPYIYDKEKQDFIYTGHCTPTLYYGIEQSLKEYKTMILARVSQVNEAHIKKGTYEEGEYERVKQAAQYIKDSPLELIHCDDYTIRELENTVKQYVIRKGIEVFIFDYIQSTNRLIAEEASYSKIKLQEYQILIEFSRRLKVLAEQQQIAVVTGCQLKADTKDMVYKDENCYAGARAIINKLDNSIILSRPRPLEKKKLEKITCHMLNCPEVNLLQWFNKIRDGELTSIIVASNMDFSTLSIQDLFVMDYDFNLINIDFTKIEEVREVVNQQSRELKNESIEDINEDEDESIEAAEQKTVRFDW